MGDYKKPESRASPASMSLESLIHGANYGKTMAEMVEASSRYDPPKSILVPPEKTKKMTILGQFLDCRNRRMWEITRSRKVELRRLICQ